MKSTIKPLLALVAVLVAVAAYTYFVLPQDSALGGGWYGFQSHIQSATSTTVGIYAPVTLFADQANAECHARVVTTNHDIRISFDDVTGYSSTTLSATVGHIQLASTTVAYGSGDFGCGFMTARAIQATTTVTVSSF